VPSVDAADRHLGFACQGQSLTKPLPPLCQ
jgi:hypothetical protein